MINRRSTLKLGAAGMFSGLTNLSGSAFASTLTQKQDMRIQGIFDSSYTESQSFSETLASNGIASLNLQDGLSTLWYEQLRSSLAANPRPLFGLTDRLSLFCLEELARDLNLKVRTRIDHLITQQGQVSHQAAGSASLHEAVQQLGNNTKFGRIMAETTDLISNLPTSSDRSERSVQKLTGPNAPLNQTALVTWVIS